MFATIGRVTRKSLHWLTHSQYARPTIFLIFFLVLVAVVTVIFEVRRNDDFATVLDGFWWTIITFSTTGYGDKVPITIGGRILAVLTIFIGIAASSLLSGGLASWLVERNTRARRGLVDYSNQKDHLIICGWKHDMKEILIDILDAAPGQSSEDMVLISNIETDKIETLQDDDRLRDLKFVRGDYFSEHTLTRAGLSQARKVLILADVLESSTLSEVDSKTVLAVLTVKSIAREVYVVAELLDKKFVNYLKGASCDEIHFSRELSRQILAGSSVTNGMSHIIYELLTYGHDKTRLVTIEIPSRFIDGPYSDYVSYVTESNGSLLLGLLENTGSPTRMKLESLRDAQKTSDVSQLVNNLQKVKDIEFNRPHLIPKRDYLIQPNTLGILLERHS